MAYLFWTDLFILPLCLSMKVPEMRVIEEEWDLCSGIAFRLVFVSWERLALVEVSKRHRTIHLSLRIVRTPSKMRWYISRGYPWNKERKNYLMSSQQWLNVPMKQTQITFGTTFLRNRLSLNPTYYIGYINKVNSLIIDHKHRMYTLIQDSC